MFGGTMVQRSQIDIHGSGEYGSADRTVRRRESRARRCGEPVDRAKSGIGQTQPSKQAGER